VRDNNDIEDLFDKYDEEEPVRHREDDSISYTAAMRLCEEQSQKLEAYMQEIIGDSDIITDEMMNKIKKFSTKLTNIFTLNIRDLTPKERYVLEEQLRNEGELSDDSVV